MPDLQFLKKLIFIRDLQNWVNISIFSYLKLFSVFIINGSAILFSNHGQIKRYPAGIYLLKF